MKKSLLYSFSTFNISTIFGMESAGIRSKSAFKPMKNTGIKLRANSAFKHMNTINAIRNVGANINNINNVCANNNNIT